jgi:fermentation-respiration switch protein FrsA (DUF1100 family)
MAAISRNTGVRPRQGKLAVVAIVATVALVLSAVSESPVVVAEAKTILFATSMLELAPVKLLSHITPAPDRQTVHLPLSYSIDSLRDGEGPVVADLTLPRTRGPHPAILVAIAVLGNDQSRTVLYEFFDTLGRLGYVVLWPRQEALERGEIMIETPRTFLRGFEYLERHADVDPNRISILGFSAGASLALIAAEDPAINDRLDSLVFFGGYYQIESFLSSVALRQAVIDGQPQPWTPDEWIVWYVSQLLEQEGLTLDQFRDWPPGKRVAQLDRYSPDRRIDSFHARLFIVHDRNDHLVPYAESLALRDALGDRTPVAFLLSDLFEHVTVETTREPSVFKLFRDLFRLHDFLLRVFLAV